LAKKIQCLIKILSHLYVRSLLFAFGVSSSLRPFHEQASSPFHVQELLLSIWQFPFLYQHLLKLFLTLHLATEPVVSE
jgi:hypothetical protein